MGRQRQRTDLMYHYARCLIRAAVAALVDLHNATVSDAGPPGSSSTASFTINNSGQFTSTGGVSAPSWTWRLSGASADYEVMFSYTGSVPTGVTFDTWLSCSTSRTVTLASSRLQDKSTNVVVKIRKGTTELDTCTIAMAATGGDVA